MAWVLVYGGGCRVGGVAGLSHGGHPGLRLRVGGVSRQVHGDHITEVTSGPSAPAVHARACRTTRGWALTLYAVCWLYLSCLQANVCNMLFLWCDVTKRFHFHFFKTVSCHVWSPACNRKSIFRQGEWSQKSSVVLEQGIQFLEPLRKKFVQKLTQLRPQKRPQKSYLLVLSDFVPKKEKEMLFPGTNLHVRRHGIGVRRATIHVGRGGHLAGHLGGGWRRQIVAVLTGQAAHLPRHRVVPVSVRVRHHRVTIWHIAVHAIHVTSNLKTEQTNKPYSLPTPCFCRRETAAKNSTW